MGRERERKKRHRSFDKDDDHHRGGRQNMDVEVLIAHDPMMPVDSDEELDLPPQMSRSSSAGSGGDRKRDSSNQRTKKKKDNKKETKKKDKDVNEDGVDNEEVFYVEKIKDKRWNGRWEWLIQWEGYGPEFDTWEPIENMDCDELLKEFEAEWEKKPKYGFDRGQLPREIVGLCLVKDQPMFLVLWKGSDDAEYVPREVCSRKCPNLVIEFYENRQIAKPGEDYEGDKDKDKSDHGPPPPPSEKQVGVA